MTVPWQNALYEALLDENVTFFAQVPDESTGELVNLLERNQEVQMVPVTREEEGIGVLSGANLAGKRVALIIQASGIGNSLNVLGSLNVPCKVPVLLLISERGGLHEFNPCQVPLGKNVEPLLNQLGVQTYRIERAEDVTNVVKGAAMLAFSTQAPVGLILTSTLTGGKN